MLIRCNGSIYRKARLAARGSRFAARADVSGLCAARRGDVRTLHKLSRVQETCKRSTKSMFYKNAFITPAGKRVGAAKGAREELSVVMTVNNARR